jgi:hypothetical protein
MVSYGKLKVAAIAGDIISFNNPPGKFLTKSSVALIL